MAYIPGVGLPSPSHYLSLLLAFFPSGLRVLSTTLVHIKRAPLSLPFSMAYFPVPRELADSMWAQSFPGALPMSFLGSLPCLGSSIGPYVSSHASHSRVYWDSGTL